MIIPFKWYLKLRWSHCKNESHPSKTNHFRRKDAHCGHWLVLRLKLRGQQRRRIQRCAVLEASLFRRLIHSDDARRRWRRGARRLGRGAAVGGATGAASRRLGRRRCRFVLVQNDNLMELFRLTYNLKFIIRSWIVNATTVSSTKYCTAKKVAMNLDERKPLQKALQ